MKSWIGGLLLGGAVVATAGAAAETFSQAVRPADFTAAGLAKLSPEELARLDALVRDFKSGALEKARRDAAGDSTGSPQAAGSTGSLPARAARVEAKAAAEAKVAATAQAEKKAEATADTGLLTKAKVRLTPGTQVEYATVESRLAGEFRGWELRSIFTLENGQRWQVTGGESYVTPPVPGPAVKIAPGALGSFWMTIDGVRPRVKVIPLGGGR